MARCGYSIKHFLDFESFLCFFLDRALESLAVKVSLDPAKLAAPPWELVDALMGCSKFEAVWSSDLSALNVVTGLFVLALRP